MSMKKVVSAALSGLGQLIVSTLLILVLGPWMALLAILALCYRGYRALDLWARWDSDAGYRARIEDKQNWRAR